ncbi:MAG TPA: hypothetical protein PKA33_01705 [Amaricoccus sp.]|uniref:hypothetical protein n=1 Tax=Amaricoccus sp. TaxID=1872485 RepID=UPI002B57EFED|nr:hypothetical protein [Amaricoccus sp.]HMR51190.1 hypothetical protein [Amaricoccus sp.]HMT98062.1 hypothetical protein [Amaricoccus sp.]
MFRIAVAIALAAAPAAAMTCDEYVDAMRAEGVRTIVALDCGTAETVPANWNDVFDTPAGACLGARLIAGDPEAMALAAYVAMMNDQREKAGCPKLTQPAPTP